MVRIRLVGDLRRATRTDGGTLGRWLESHDSPAEGLVSPFGRFSALTLLTFYNTSNTCLEPTGTVHLISQDSTCWQANTDTELHAALHDMHTLLNAAVACLLPPLLT